MWAVLGTSSSRISNDHSVLHYPDRARAVLEGERPAAHVPRRAPGELEWLPDVRPQSLPLSGEHDCCQACAVGGRGGCHRTARSGRTRHAGRRPSAPEAQPGGGVPNKYRPYLRPRRDGGGASPANHHDRRPQGYWLEPQARLCERVLMPPAIENICAGLLVFVFGLIIVSWMSG